MALDGLARSTVEPAARLDTTDRPGARRSGLATPSAVGPLAEKVASLSSLLLTVVRSLLDPTVTTNGSFPGARIVPAALPPLPAAVTTVMPAFHNRSTAKSSGSTAYGCCVAKPSDRLTTRMLYAAAKSFSHSSASSTSVTSVAPSAPEIFSDTSLAPGATPSIAPEECAPVPAIRPATNVPWP